jgi:hypothetical protein
MGQRIAVGGSGFQFTFTGPVSQTYEVLASDDMTLPQSAWTVVGTGTFTGSIVSFTDPDAVNHPQRYYLVKSP